MATLATSTQDEIQRLLELFPLLAIKLTWPELKGNKDEICQAVARQADHERIASFILRNFSRCRQHVYLLSETQDGMSASKAFPEIDPLVGPNSTTTEAMDLEQGIKKTNPALYAEMQSRPILDTNFRIDPEHDSPVKAFQVNPTSGKIGFSSYTEAQGGSDAIVQEILARNR